MKSKYFLFLLVLSFVCKAQVIYNAYASVSTISGSTFTIGTVDESNHTFINGEQVIIVQMQDDVIGTNTLNTASFGNLATIKSAGLWEVRTIQSQTRLGGILQSLTFTAPLANSYNVGTNSSLQVITFRQLSATAFTSTNDITALPWNGAIGGVIAIEVGTSFTLNHSISADGLGFRRGIVSNDDGSNCINSVFISNSSSYGEKGESIYKSTDPNFRYAQAKILNGGGGGVTHNGGGGGGSNYTAGGAGGPGWNGSFVGCSPSAAGEGGIALSTFILPSRLFMGGGGGGAQQNNSLGSNGANGGGIVIVKANQLITNNTCVSPIRISANGNNAANTTGGFNDAAGGGGGAGSVVLQINSYSVSSTCPLTIQSNGGNGGSSPFGTTHAGGGAGGQGIVVFSVVQPTLNTTTSTNNGSPGCNDNSNPCTNLANAASGTNNLGIFSGISGVLPVELLSFEVFDQLQHVELNWITVSERNTDFYIIERSLDGLNWTDIGYVKATNEPNHKQAYSYFDKLPLTGVSYYRLRIVDFDRSMSYSPIKSIIYISSEITVTVVPNPANNNVSINSSIPIMFIRCEVLEVTGKRISPVITTQNETQLNIDFTTYARGIYLLKCYTPNNSFVKYIKLVLQ